MTPNKNHIDNKEMRKFDVKLINLFNMKTKISQILKISIIISLIGLFAFTIYYVNRIQIISPVEVIIEQPKQFKSIELIGYGPMNRKFNINPNNNRSCYNTNDLFLNKLVLRYQSNVTNDTTFRIIVNENKYQIFVPKNASNDIVEYNIPNLESTNFFHKLSFLIQFYGKRYKHFNLLNILIIFCIFMLIISQKGLSINNINKESILIIIGFAFLILLLITAFYLYPTAEEYEIGSYAKEYKFKLPIHYYTFMDGRYFLNLLYVYANPIFYDAYKLLFIPAILLFLGLTCSFYYFFKTISPDSSQKSLIAFSLTSMILYLNFSPSPSILLYSYCSSMGYTLLTIVILIQTTLAIKFINQQKPKLFYALILLIIIGNGLNEISIIINSFFFLLFIFYYRKIDKYSISMGFILALSFSIVLLSPGSHLRKEYNDIMFQNFQSNVSQIEILIHSLLVSVKNTFHMYFRLIINPNFLISLILIASIHTQTIQKKIKLNLIQTTIIFPGIVLLNTLIVFPYYYSCPHVWDVEPLRINNIQHLFILFQFIIGMILFYNKYPKIALKIEQTNSFLFAILLVLLLSNSHSFLSDFIDDAKQNRFELFREEMNTRLKQYPNKEYNPYKTTILPIQNKPNTIFIQNEWYYPRWQNNIMHFFDNYTLEFPSNDNKVTTSQQGIFEDLSKHSQIFGENFPCIRIIMRPPMANILYLQHATIIKNSNSINTLDEKFDFENVYQNLIQIDTSILKCLYETPLTTPDNLSDNERLKVYSIFSLLFPTCITKIDYLRLSNSYYKAILEIQNHSTKHKGILTFDYNISKQQITNISLYNYLKGLISFKSKLYSSNESEKSPIVYSFDYNINQDSLLYKISFITKENISYKSKIRILFSYLKDDKNHIMVDTIHLNKNYIELEEIFIKKSIFIDSIKDNSNINISNFQIKDYQIIK